MSVTTGIQERSELAVHLAAATAAAAAAAACAAVERRELVEQVELILPKIKHFVLWHASRVKKLAMRGLRWSDGPAASIAPGAHASLSGRQQQL
jgi:hypothetical protein